MDVLNGPAPAPISVRLQIREAVQHVERATGREFDRWIPVEDRPAMVGWGWDAPDDHPWRDLH